MLPSMASRTERDKRRMWHIPDISILVVKPMVNREYTAFSEAATALMAISF
jgi:hypothetical protein